MAEYAQKEIMAGLKTCLEKIKISNGFKTDVIRVDRGIRSIEDFEGDLPAATLWKVTSERVSLLFGAYEGKVNIKLWGYVVCDTSNSNFDPLDNFQGDCAKILTDKVYNPDFYNVTEVGNTAYYEAGVEENFGIFEMDVTVKYSGVTI